MFLLFGLEYLDPHVECAEGPLEVIVSEPSKAVSILNDDPIDLASENQVQKLSKLTALLIDSARDLGKACHHVIPTANRMFE